LTDIAKVSSGYAQRRVIGDAEYAAICGELNLPSDSIDDIPNVRRSGVAGRRGGGGTGPVKPHPDI
jgi:hypothetical protein